MDLIFSQDGSRSIYATSPEIEDTVSHPPTPQTPDSGQLNKQSFIDRIEYMAPSSHPGSSSAIIAESSPRDPHYSVISHPGILAAAVGKKTGSVDPLTYMR